MARTVNTICRICGKHFYKRPSQKEQYNKHYCSLKCRSKGQFKNKTKVCKICKNEFEYKRTEQKFCSVKCAASRPRKDRINGKGKNKSQTVLKLFKLNGWDKKCMIKGCNYNFLLDVHRIMQGKDGGKYVYDNTVAICPNHHAEIHRLNKKIKKINNFVYILEN